MTPARDERARGRAASRDHQRSDDGVAIGMPYRNARWDIRNAKYGLKNRMCRSTCDGASHGSVRERPEQVVTRIDPGDRGDPAQACSEHEEDHGERGNRTDAAEPSCERVQGRR